MDSAELAWQAPYWYWQKHIVSQFGKEECFEGDAFMIRRCRNFLLVECRPVRWRVILWASNRDQTVNSIFRSPYLDEGRLAYRYIISTLFPNRAPLHPHAPLLYIEDDVNWLSTAAQDLTDILFQSFRIFIASRLREAGFIPIWRNTALVIELERDSAKERRPLMNALARSLAGLKFKFKVGDEELIFHPSMPKSFGSDTKWVEFSTRSASFSSRSVQLYLNFLTWIGNEITLAIDDISPASYSITFLLEDIVKRYIPKSLESQSFDVALSRFFNTAIKGKIYTGLVLPVTYWGPEGDRDELIRFPYLALDDIEIKVNGQKLYVGKIDNIALNLPELRILGLRLAIKRHIIDIRTTPLNLAAINSYLREIGR